MRYRTLGSHAFAIAVAFLFAGSTRVVAQSAQAVSLQVSGLYIGFGGSAYSDMSAGAGAEAQLRYTSGAMSLGLGYQYTRHTMEGEEGHMNNSGVFIEPRYVFTTSSPTLAPYVSARLGLLRMNGIMDEDSNGGTVNFGGGVLARLTSRTNLDFGATYGYTRFSGGISGTGSDLVLRAGLAIGLGG
ncbi:MAG TPA: hypothetical protein VM076_11470 [Gemmatimonadaceae bacterium]|nr:hypothetical protein [Gemmatimonadaceae bacterium]